MFRIVRTRTLRQASSQTVELHDRAETQRLRAERAEQALGHAEGALEILRAKHLLDPDTGDTQPPEVSQ